MNNFENRLASAIRSGDSTTVNGLGIELNDQGNTDRAQELWLTAASFGNSTAMYNLGLSVGSQATSSTDFAQGSTWMIRAADCGFVPAMLHLGAQYQEDDRWGRSEFWLGQAARSGNAEAATKLSDLYEGRAQSVSYWYESSRDEESFWNSKAEALRARSAKNSEEDAQNDTLVRQVAEPRYLESYELPPNEDFLRTSADWGNSAAANQLGFFFHGRNEIDGAIEWWTRASDLGCASAMSNLGFLYQARDDPALAESWWLRAVKAGCWAPVDGLFSLYVALKKVEETVFLAKLLLRFHELQDPVLDRGDTETAESMFSWAAGEGNLDAMRSLACLQAEKENYLEVSELLERAASQGHVASMVDLGFLWNIAQISYEDAKFWLGKAADLGDEAAIEFLSEHPNFSNKG